MTYIGIDAHMSSCSLCVMDKEGTILDQATLSTNGRVLVEYLQKFAGSKKAVIEECDTSGWLRVILKGHVDLMVCDPSKSADYKRGKTDKLDAKRLADLLRGGFLTPVYHDDSPREHLRYLVSAYMDAVWDVVRIKNRFKALFRRQGIKMIGRAVYKDARRIAELSAPEIVLIARSLMTRLEKAEEEKGVLKAALEKAAPAFPEVRYLDSVPGLGVIQAVKIISQVIDPKRFKNKYRFFSYCGLVRHRRLSAGKAYGSRKAHGNRTLKCVYKMAAHSSLRGDGPMKAYYNGLRQRGRSHKHAEQAVARMIAAVSLAVWKKGQKFKKEIFTPRDSKETLVCR